MNTATAPAHATPALAAPPTTLHRASVVAAITEYLVEANIEGYRPNPRKALAVRKSDRKASLRDAGAPVRDEVYYFIEDELFPEPDATCLAEGETPAAAARRLVDGVWDRLWVWNAFDFARSTSGWQAP
ncbi:MAG: hypothetical protein LBR05_06205 [Azoarcus sp.]|jgi:hypothetical protein|nr:hypothetical protein [Azoarcus sp.]